MKLMQLPEDVRERILDSARNVISGQVSGTRTLIASWNEVLNADYMDPSNNAVPGNTILFSQTNSQSIS